MIEWLEVVVGVSSFFFSDDFDAYITGEEAIEDW